MARHGGAGSDTMAGGTGDDTYEASDSGDVIIELADQGLDTVYTRLSGYVPGANLENLRYAGTGAFLASDNELDNVMVIDGAVSAVLDGGAGDDTVIVGLNFSDYAVAYAGGVATLTHNGNAVALRNVEYVMFADGPARPLAEVLHNIATDGNEV